MSWLFPITVYCNVNLYCEPLFQMCTYICLFCRLLLGIPYSRCHSYKFVDISGMLFFSLVYAGKSSVIVCLNNYYHVFISFCSGSCKRLAEISTSCNTWKWGRNWINKMPSYLTSVLCVLLDGRHYRKFDSHNIQQAHSYIQVVCLTIPFQR